MGVLSDLVLGTGADVENIGKSDVPSRDFDGVDVKGIDSIKLGTLQSILTGESFDALIEEYDPVYEGSEDGPWVFKLPERLVSRLASLTSEERRATSDEWAITEEFTIDDWDRQDVLTTFDAIASMASKAIASGQTLYLWMSL